jgi:hypothetical protein
VVQEEQGLELAFYWDERGREGAVEAVGGGAPVGRH